MSQLRRRWKVVLDDVEREVRTTARDIAAVDDDLPDAGWRTIHHAMIRSDIDGIPTDYDDWLDMLDEVKDLEAKPSGGNGASPPSAEGGPPAVTSGPTKPRRRSTTSGPTPKTP